MYKCTVYIYMYSITSFHAIYNNLPDHKWVTQTWYGQRADCIKCKCRSSVETTFHSEWFKCRPIVHQSKYYWVGNECYIMQTPTDLWLPFPPDQHRAAWIDSLDHLSNMYRVFQSCDCEELGERKAMSCSFCVWVRKCDGDWGADV